MNKLKSFFQDMMTVRKPPSGQMVAAVVYRRFRGRLTIFALKDKKGDWSIPAGRAQPGETGEQAVKRIAAGGLNPDDLKVWQSLGRFQADEMRDTPDGVLDYFLVQALSNSEPLRTEDKQPPAVWLSVEEVLERVDAGTAEIIMLAVAKLKRAQV